MDEATTVKYVIEALEGVGADDVRAVTRYVAGFGPRTIEVVLLDAGPLFPKRYEARATDEVGKMVSSGACATITGALGTVPWKDLLLH